MPALSLIVPIYNAEKYLQRTLDCIYVQTFDDFECILVDDGSTDASARICSEICCLDQRFRLISQPNGGVSSARNTGLENAKGRWIGWVDADDTLHPQMFRSLVEEAERHQADIVCCGVEIVHTDGRRSAVPFRKSTAVEQFLRNPVYMYSLFNKLYRAEAIQSRRFATELSSGEDLLMNAILFEQCRNVCHLEAVLYGYHETHGSITNSDPHLRHQKSRERSCSLLEQSLGMGPGLAGQHDRLIQFRKLVVRMFYLKSREHRNLDSFRALYPETNRAIATSPLHPATRLAGLLAIAGFDSICLALLHLGDRGFKNAILSVRKNLRAV